MPACQSSQNPESITAEQPNSQQVVVKEVLQTSNYTYLRVTENKNDKWLAVPLMQAKAGDTYYYNDAMLMTNFTSKELNRTFDTIYFLNGVSPEPIKVSTDNSIKNDNYTSASSPHSTNGSATVEKKEIKISTPADGITIAQLFSEKNKYSGKTVKIRGEVTKFNAAIMNKNWIHIQDGTDFNGKFDFTITSDIEVKVGETVTLEGKIVLDKDLGHGYFFEVMMEDAVKK